MNNLVSGLSYRFSYQYNIVDLTEAPMLLLNLFLQIIVNLFPIRSKLMVMVMKSAMNVVGNNKTNRIENLN